MQRMKRFFKNGKEIIETNKNPQEILSDSLLNKGTGFTFEERTELGLHGLLPVRCSTIDEQVARKYENFCMKQTPIEKYIFLTTLQDRNETLFFKLLEKHSEEILPYIYTPTVGDASVQFSTIHHQKRGIYISYPLRDQMEEIVANIPHEDVKVIIVTDGGRILGLGDLGIGGMAIPIGKLSLYTLFGGIHPAHTLPIVLDVGTNNPNLLDEPLYLGWRHKRIAGKEYEEFIESFVRAIQKRYPTVLLQWEDFSKEHAQPLLTKYRDQLCSFNDDIQGTAGVVMAGIFSALKALNSSLKEQRIVLYGAGSAGVGIADLIVQAMIREGIPVQEAKEKIYILGKNGLAHTGSENLDHLKKKYAQEKEEIKKWKVVDLQNISLLEVVSHVKPTILIGTSTHPGSFSEEVVKEMKKHIVRPIIFPLSNPTSKSEAKPEDLIKWSDGQAIIATGSPFAPVNYQGNKITIGQCNNVYIYPGVGLGIIASRASRVTDQMFLRAAEVLSDHAPILNNPFASLFPKISHLSAICTEVAIEIGKLAIEQGISEENLDDIEQKVIETRWKAEYPQIKRLERESQIAASALS
ncbi:MAG: NAD-dependent malic enzyme [Simkania negevensis]|nr:NAD-dependent malic enzyme [Simkania negevensis]